MLVVVGQTRKPVRIGMPRKGKYMVREDIEKAPTHDHPCNLTRTAIRISFPEMKDEVFINLLGYKEPNLVHLLRCKGRCAGVGGDHACAPTRLKDTAVNMRVKSFLTGKEPRERLRELILEEHVECGCQCPPQVAALCGGEFEEATCRCHCPMNIFGQNKIRCESRLGVWDEDSCRCRGKNVVARGVDRGDCSLAAGFHGLSGSYERVGGTEVVGWLLLGSSLTLVLILSASSIYYWRRARLLRAACRGRTSCEELSREEVSFLATSSSRNEAHFAAGEAPEEAADESEE